MSRTQVTLLALAGAAALCSAGFAGAQSRPAAAPAAKPVAAPAPAAKPALSNEALYLAKCGYCHLEGGTGTFMLGRRLGKENALLGKRTDLPADYVIAVARNGLNSMPTITRVEVSDAELQKIAAFIASKKKASGK